MKWLLTLFALFAVTAAATDVTGTWKGTAETPNGSIERTFVFKVDGATLTGETSSEMLGTSKIKNGKVDGDNLSFSITASFQGNDMEINYTGKVSSDGKEIKFKAEIPAVGQTVEYIVKRIS
jgi:hypothetical protein